MTPKNYGELELRDDFIFGKAMEDQGICRQMLEMLLGRRIEKISFPERQKTVGLRIGGKSIRLDLYVQDENNAVYSAEMQQPGSRKARQELPRRSRYYQGLIDLNLLQRGAAYAQLGESFIIFICTFDPFGQNRPKYTFQTRCGEDTGLVLADMATKIFFNTKGDREGIPEGLRAFLDYVETKEAADSFTRQLDQAVEAAKHNEQWRQEYMKELLIRYDERIEGLAEGMEKGFEKGETLFASLAGKLLAEGRTRELLQATADVSYRRQLYQEYGL